MRGKQVSPPPAPFRKVEFGRRREVTTHTAGVNPASLVTTPSPALPQKGRDTIGAGLGPPSLTLPASNDVDLLSASASSSDRVGHLLPSNEDTNVRVDGDLTCRRAPSFS